jgi:hypothetical protein
MSYKLIAVSGKLMAVKNLERPIHHAYPVYTGFEFGNHFCTPDYQ